MAACASADEMPAWLRDATARSQAQRAHGRPGSHLLLSAEWWDLHDAWAGLVEERLERWERNAARRDHALTAYEAASRRAEQAEMPTREEFTLAAHASWLHPPAGPVIV